MAYKKLMRMIQQMQRENQELNNEITKLRCDKNMMEVKVQLRVRSVGKVHEAF